MDGIDLWGLFKDTIAFSSEFWVEPYIIQSGSPECFLSFSSETTQVATPGGVADICDPIAARTFLVSRPSSHQMSPIVF